MKKHKTEVTIAIVFISLIVLLMWQSIANIYQYLPIILICICLIIIALLISPFLDKNKKDSQNREAYAPIHFAKSILSSIIGISVILGIAVVLNKNNFSKTFDLTSNKINSLSPETIKVISSLNKQIDIYCIPGANAADNYCENNIDLINLYEKNSIQIVSHKPVGLGDRVSLQKLQPSGFARLVLLTDNNKSEVEGSLSESKLTNAIINLVKFKKVVYFLSGNGEPSISGENLDRSYSDIVSSLQNKAYEVKEWNIKQGNIPAEARVLIAGDNNIPYGEEAQNIIKNFIAKGGRLALIVNPYREHGLEKIYSELNLKLEPILLTLNTKTPIGQEIQNQNLSRPPVIASNFNMDSPITKVIAQVYGVQAVMPIDGGRPISILDSVNNPKIKTISNVLMSSYSAAPITISPETRNKIDLNSPFTLAPDAKFDPNKTWPLAVSVDVSGASHFAPSSNSINNKETDPLKDRTEVVVFGFSMVGPYSKAIPITEELLPITVAHLYQDQELVSIPPRDFTPKQFNLSRNPGTWLPLFAGILPVFTAISGVLIWFRRRSA